MTPVEAPEEDPLQDGVARLAALARSPELAELLAREVPDHRRPRQLLGSLAGLMVFVLVGIALAVVLAGACPPLSLLPVALVAVGGYTFLRQLTRREEEAPLERGAALVLGQRAGIRGAADGAAARTRHEATLRLADGSERVLETSSEVASRLLPGEVGVAHLRGERLVDFEGCGVRIARDPPPED